MTAHQRKVTFVESTSAQSPDHFLSIVGSAAPTLVAIHGVSRNAAEIAARFTSHPAFAEVNIVAPLFDREKFGKYQQLATRQPDQTPSDEALFNLLAELSATYGIDTRQVMLFGFSGGGQMAHRVAMLYPSRVSALCVTAAGWYLMPDRQVHYPYGLADANGEEGHCDAFSAIPITVAIGSLDNRVDANVNQKAAIIDRQGRTRLRRARTWVAEMARYAASQGRRSNVELILLDNVTHDFSQCALRAGLIETTAYALLDKRTANAKQYCLQGE